MNQVEVFTEIDAPPPVVWRVLLEFDSYPEWNPFIRAIEGVPVEDERAEDDRTVRERTQVRIEPSEPYGTLVTPEVITVEENRRLVWLERLLVPFAFDGYHEFHLDPIDDGRRTRLLQRETVRGALVPLLFDATRIERGFVAMNEAIRDQAERRASAPA